MTTLSGGTKRSSWLTFRRRLLLVRTLLRGPASGGDLVAGINAEMGEQGYPMAAAAALKHDFDALKGEYGCQIAYDRATRRYALAGLGELALLNLPDESMEALAFLDASFPEDGGLPEQASVRALLDRVLLLLPPARQAQHRSQRGVARQRAAAPVAPATYRLRYSLLPQVARRLDLSAYFPNTQVVQRPDGGAEVTASVTNLWQARQVLLRYGDACLVHEPPELVALFQQAAQGLARLYPPDDA